ncbi:MAG: endonuclease/exonuclease/phosphatase family protein [Halobaculum sp.]
MRYAGVDEGTHAWERRRDAVATTIRTAAPDLLATQEVWLGQLADLQERLNYAWVAHPDDTGPHTPIAYRSDRFTVVESGAFGLAPGGERGVLGWDAAYPRTVTHATFRDRRMDRTFQFCSIHLDHRGEEARREGARLVTDRLSDGPAVVAGDCNCEPGSEPYRRLTDVASDTAETAMRREGPRETYVGFSENGNPDARRLDYVFGRGCAVRRHHTLDPDGHPSDHRPVVVELSVE